VNMAAISESSKESAFWCGFYGLGIIVTLVVYGLFQERIMTQPYGDEIFETSVFLVFCNRAVAALYSLSMAIANGESLAHQAPISRYMIVSLSNVYASTCQYEALKYVTFIVQMLGKSFKMIPVMLWGMTISGKRYNWIDWMVALIVTWGVTQFLITGPIEAESGVSEDNPIKGLMLLLGFLALDGLTSTMQEKCFRDYHTTKYNQMLYVNLCSVIVSSITLITSGGGANALAFCAAHPAFPRDALVLSACATSGQWFIYSQIKEFGALVFAASMNVRQVVSILASNQTFDHALTFGQWSGLGLVFGALFVKSYMGLTAEAAPDQKVGRTENKAK